MLEQTSYRNLMKSLGSDVDTLGRLGGSATRFSEGQTHFGNPVRRKRAAVSGFGNVVELEGEVVKEGIATAGTAGAAGGSGTTSGALNDLVDDGAMSSSPTSATSRTKTTTSSGRTKKKKKKSKKKKETFSQPRIVGTYVGGGGGGQQGGSGGGSGRGTTAPPTSSLHPLEWREAEKGRGEWLPTELFDQDPEAFPATVLDDADFFRDLEIRKDYAWV